MPLFSFYYVVEHTYTVSVFIEMLVSALKNSIKYCPEWKTVTLQKQKNGQLQIK